MFSTGVVSARLARPICLARPGVHTMSTDPAFLSARDLLVQFRARTLSPLEALEAVLKRLAADNPELNAFHLVDVEMGRRMAKESEARWMKGEPIGALDGVPVPIKDTNAAKGWPFRIGSKTTPPHPGRYHRPPGGR